MKTAYDFAEAFCNGVDCLKVLDHFIVAGSEALSFAERGLL
mgnify:CR=1 FL=1